MMQSMNSLNSALLSYSSLKTISSVKNRMQGRANVLESEISTGGGNTEAKKEELKEQNEKISDVSDQLNEGLGKLNQEVNRPLTSEEKEKLLEEKKAEKEQNEQKLEDQQQSVQKQQTDGQIARHPEKDSFVRSDEVRLQNVQAGHVSSGVSLSQTDTGKIYQPDGSTPDVAPVTGENLNTSA